MGRWQVTKVGEKANKAFFKFLKKPYFSLKKP